MIIIGEDDAPLDENGNPTGDIIALLYPDGNFVISGTGPIPTTCSYENWNYVARGAWGLDNSAQTDKFDLANRISKVTINEGITSIPDYCFVNLISLQEMTIPSTVTNIGKDIVNCPNGGYSNLTNVNFASGFAGSFHKEFESDGIQYSDSFRWCPWLTPYTSYVHRWMRYPQNYKWYGIRFCIRVWLKKCLKHRL